MRIAFILMSLTLLPSCMPTKAVDPNTTTGKINQEAPYMWSSSAFPAQFKISEQFDSGEIANIEAMSTAWEAAVENKKDFFDHGTTKASEISSPNLDLNDLGYDNVMGIYKIMDWPRSLTGSALAVTQIFGRRYNIGSGSEYVRIEHADILINNHFYDFRTGNSHVNNTFDFRTVVLHEMGHFLGLSHKYGDTIMIPSIDEYVERRAPFSMDMGDLAAKYGVSLGSGSGSAMASMPNAYTPRSGDDGVKVRLILELMPDGECIHKEDGVTIGRHPASLK